MIVYIAGKMTGLQDLGNAAFDRAEHKLTGLGYQVLNPAWLGKGLPKETYMPICLSMLQQADAIVMLDGWEDSPGARLEKAYAEYQLKPVYYLYELLTNQDEVLTDLEKGILAKGYGKVRASYGNYILCEDNTRCGDAIEVILKMMGSTKGAMRELGVDPERYEEKLFIKPSEKEGTAFYLGYRLNEKG